ncbi:MAG: AAC(3) family N-acetyltransferase [Lentisphaeria bacterium]|nr:AAC(3) family N-acetyltransferase [Lentisphaeria bacterium]
MSVSRKDIAEAFRAAGCVPGDTVMIHSSMKSIGHVDGNGTAVFDGVLDAAGPGGTVATPSLWYNGKPAERRKEDFDVNSSPAYVGYLPEAMRLDPRSYRSNHFSHAVCAIGARAKELTQDHGNGKLFPCPWDDGAFAEVSPWSKFYQWNALYCFIGVDMDTCTIKHYIESRIVDELLQTLPPERYNDFRMQLGHDCGGGLRMSYNGVKMRERLEELGLIKKVSLGNTTLMTLRTRALVDTTMDILRRELKDWCLTAFYDWSCQVREAAQKN